MYCTEIHKLIDDYLDKQLSGDVQARTDAHLEHCSPCRHRVHDEQVLREALRDMPVPAPSAGFAARALRRAAVANQATRQTRQRHAFVAGFAVAMVAVGVLWFVTGVYSPEGGVAVTQSQLVENGAEAIVPGAHVAEPGMLSPEFSIAQHETRRVELAFSSTQAVQGVRISLEFPENVELEGYPGKRQIAWLPNLKQGENVLTLPLLANSPQGGEFIARIEYGTTIKELRLKLNVDKPGFSTLNLMETV
jgi:hypothetical protein